MKVSMDTGLTSYGRLNITIEYILGPRNKCADGLSRTVFRQEDCSEDSQVHKLSEALVTHGPQWVWKDGKGGYEQMLTELSSAEREEILDFGTANGLRPFSLGAVAPQANTQRQQESSV